MNTPKSLLTLLKDEDQQLNRIDFLTKRVIWLEQRLEEDPAPVAEEMYQQDLVQYDADLTATHNALQETRIKLSTQLRRLLSKPM